VSFSAGASDNIDGAVTPVCTPASGAVFAANAAGASTTVTCTATDSSRNVTKKTFTVHVKGAAEQLGEVAVQIAAVGPKNGLTTNLVSTVTATAKLVGTSFACSNLGRAQTLAAQQKAQLGTAAQSDQILASMKRVGAVLACK
jgi:large repetitive protein